MTLSLRSRFTLLAASAAAVAVIGVAVASWFVVQAKLNQRFDDQLRSYAELATKSSTASDAPATVRPADQPTSDEDQHAAELIVQFVDPSGAVTTAGGGSIPTTAVRGRVEVLRIGHDQYRVFTVPAPDGGLVRIARDAEGIERTLAELGLLHALIGAVGVLGAAVLGRSVARTALRPVDVLTAGAERVARTQDLTATILLTAGGTFLTSLPLAGRQLADPGCARSPLDSDDRPRPDWSWLRRSASACSPRPRWPMSKDCSNASRSAPKRRCCC